MLEDDDKALEDNNIYPWNTTPTRSVISDIQYENKTWLSDWNKTKAVLGRIENEALKQCFKCINISFEFSILDI